MTLLKLFLVIVKSLLFYIFDSLALFNATSPQKNKFELVLLVRQDAIGDFIMWLDTAKEYRQLYPPNKYKIILVGNASWCDLAQELTYWDEIIQIDLKRFKTISWYRWNFLRKFKNLGAKTAIQPTYSREYYHGDAIVRASNALRKVGSVGDMSNRNWLKKIISDRWHTELIPSSPEPLSELERNAEFFSGFLQKKHLSNYPKIEVLGSWEIINFKQKEFYVLSLGANKNYRAWPVNFYGEIAQRIHAYTGWIGLICGVQNEFILGEQIKKICDAPLENYAGRTSLTELAWLIAKCQTLICNESGTAHIAMAVGTSTVCIAGGGHFGRFVPYPEFPGQTNKLEVVFHEMPCYGCNWKCIYKIKKGDPTPCISNIRVDEVWNKIKPLLNE